MNKEIMRKLGFGKEVKMIEDGLCPCCGKPIGKQFFRDALSRKEYRISGFCQKCQDGFFEEEK